MYISSDSKFMVAVTEEMKRRNVDFYTFADRKGRETIAYKASQSGNFDALLRDLIGEAPPGHNGVCYSGESSELSRNTLQLKLQRANVKTIVADPRYTGDHCLFWGENDEGRVLKSVPTYREFSQHIKARNEKK